MTEVLPTRRSVRLADVAQLAGVSSQTVSRVVRGAPNVAAETRSRVELALEQLDYQPNLAARSLSRRRTNVIHIINATPLFHGHARTFLSIVSKVYEYGFHASISGLPQGEEPSLTKLIPLGVDGVIVLGGHRDSTELAELIAKRAPVVLVGDSGDVPDDVASVSIDQYQGAYLAGQHLIDVGCTHLFHIAGPEDWKDSHDRIAGFTTACDQAGVGFAIEHAQTWDSGSGYAVAHAISRDADGLFAGNDQLALGAMRYLAEHGRQIPGDIAVVGFDNADGTDNFQPPLTTVKQRFRTVGESAVTQLIDLIDGKPAHHIQLAPTLVVRQSTLRK